MEMFQATQIYKSTGNLKTTRFLDHCSMEHVFLENYMEVTAAVHRHKVRTSMVDHNTIIDSKTLRTKLSIDVLFVRSLISSGKS